MLIIRHSIRAIIQLSNLYRRMLAAWLGIAGARTAYLFAGTLARALYRLLEPVRLRSEMQCKAALADRIPTEDVPNIARQSFIHRVWNLTDLMLAQRLLHPNTYHRFGGKIPEPYRTQLQDAQNNKQPSILVTGYYGPIDLLPIFLGYNGIQAGVVYRPHENKDFDLYRKRIRGQSGCELIPADRGADRIADILDAGGTVAIVADHHADKRGMPAKFLGLPTMAARSVGLLAWRYNADVVVAGIRRLNNMFHFEISVTAVMKHPEWSKHEDPVKYITEGYLQGLEELILEDPSQYLWGYARWGKEFTSKLTGEYQGEKEEVSG